MRYLKIKNCGINPKTHEAEYLITEYKKLLGIKYHYITYSHRYTSDEIIDMLKLVGNSQIKYE